MFLAIEQLLTCEKVSWRKNKTAAMDKRNRFCTAGGHCPYRDRILLFLHDEYLTCAWRREGTPRQMDRSSWNEWIRQPMFAANNLLLHMQRKR